MIISFCVRTIKALIGIPCRLGYHLFLDSKEVSFLEPLLLERVCQICGRIERKQDYFYLSRRREGYWKEYHVEDGHVIEYYLKKIDETVDKIFKKAEEHRRRGKR